MPLLLFIRKALLVSVLGAVFPSLAFAQSGFSTQGGEFPMTGGLPGDETEPHISLRQSGGYIVWQDNSTDGFGLGISARRIDSSLSGALNVFRVNEQGAGNQENPEVMVLDNGGAAFVWQGGPQERQQIYARFLSSGGTWLTGDVLANSYTNSHHVNPVIAKLADGNVVIAWGSFDQDGSLQGVYAQKFSPTGQKIGGEFQVNQTTSFNQRTPVVAGLSDGNFVVAWVSEKQISEQSFEVYVFARRFNASGTPLSNEFRVNTGTNVCANPSITASPEGGFLIAWGEKDVVVPNNSWDIFARSFSNAGVGGTARRLNTMTYGDQYAPRAAVNGSSFFVVWTSLGQDGSWHGVYGQFLHGDGSLAGGELRVNTTFVSQQIHPTVAADGNTRFLVAWSSFGGGVNSFELHAQRYVSDSQPLLPPDAPYVSALSSSKLSVTWPVLSGFDVAHYELHVDGASPPVVVTNNMWVNTVNFVPGSTHTFRLAYVLADGRRSPLSAQATGTTWGFDDNFDGLPDDWQTAYWGSNPVSWPSPNVDSDGDGVSDRNEFLAGTNPLDPNSVLRTRLTATPQGLFVSWNTEPGLMYQVQSSSNLVSWVNHSSPRFAVGQTDSVLVGGGNSTYYRILRLR